MSAARAVLRLARRELLRRPWRTLLVLLLVLVPSAAVAAGVTFLRTGEWSPADRLAAQVGSADLTAHATSTDTPAPRFPGASDADADVRALHDALPPQSRIVVEHRMEDRVRAGDDRAYFTISDVDLDDPIVDGRFGAVRGRLPRRAGEAVVSRDVADDLGLRIGDDLRPERLARRVTVVGVVTPRSWPENLVVTPGSMPATYRQVHVWVDVPGRPYADRTGVDGSVPTTGLARVPGWELSPAVAWGSTAKTQEVFWTWVAGGVALSVLGTVIAAAFAVSARRQLRTIGLLAATGASPRAIRWFLVAQGAVTGLVGAGAGVALGVAAAHATPDRWLDAIAGHDVDGAVTRPTDVVPVIVLGVVAASVAAWLPARSVGTLPTLQALAGRRPLGVVPARLPALGALSALGGCALFAMAVSGAGNGDSSMWALVAVAGGIACLFGAVAICPWIVAALEPLSGHWTTSARLAGRGMARTRVRSSAVAGAITAVTGTLVAGTTLFATFDARTPESLPWIAPDHVRIESYSFGDRSDVDGARPAAPPEHVLRRVAALVPGASTIQLDEVVAVDADAHERVWSDLGAGPSAPFGTAGGVAVADETTFTLFGIPADIAARADDGAIVLGADEDTPDAVTISVPGTNAHTAIVAVAGTYESPSAATSLPRILLSAEAIAELGLTTRPSGSTILDAPAPLTAEQRADIRRLSSDIGWEQGWTTGAQVHVVGPDDPEPISKTALRAIAMSIALALVAVVVAIGLALAAKDSRDERQVLVAVGAAPRVLRRVAALRAALLVAAAGVVAVPTGLLAAWAIALSSRESHDPSTLHVDLVIVAFVLVGAPALVATVVAAAGTLRGAFRAPRPATFSFAD